MSEQLQILSAVHGIAPRSEGLLKLGIDHEKGRVSKESFDEKIFEETQDWLAVQFDTGIDIQENGKLNWQDHLRPIVKVASGFAENVDEGQVTRWYENNRFYRKPVITDRLSLNIDAFEETFPKMGEHLSLLSPNTFASLCDNNYAELDPKQNVLQLYAELLFWVEQRGVSRVTLEEYENSSVCASGKDHALADIETLASWYPNLQFSVINPRNTAVVIPWRLESNLGLQIPPSDIEIIAREPDYRRPDFKEGEVWHQVIDSSTTQSQDIQALRSVEALITLGASRLVLTHTVDLECVPLSYAHDKIKQLGEFAAELRAQL